VPAHRATTPVDPEPSRRATKRSLFQRLPQLSSDSVNLANHAAHGSNGFSPATRDLSRSLSITSELLSQFSFNASRNSNPRSFRTLTKQQGVGGSRRNFPNFRFLPSIFWFLVCFQQLTDSFGKYWGAHQIHPIKSAAYRLFFCELFDPENYSAGSHVYEAKFPTRRTPWPPPTTLAGSPDSGYLLLIALRPLFLIYIPGKLYVKGNAAATMSNIAAHERLFRIGILAELLGGLILIFLVLAFYRLFKCVDPYLAVLVIILGGVMPAVIYFVE
jgi:Domain of unknown function (DUF4386)